MPPNGFNSRDRRWLWQRLILFALVSVFGLMLLRPTPQAVAASSPLRVPPGFEIGVFAEHLAGVRSLTLGSDGLVYAGGREAGTVWALRDTGGRGQADERHLIASGLNQPNGVAFRDGALYVAEIGRILVFEDIARHLDAPPGPRVVRDDLPTETHHGWRYIGFGPDSKLYVAIGAPCNVCEPAHFERDGAKLEFGSITRMDPDGRHWEVVARGVRNSVGFDWSPDGHLWFTSNGRDLLGDDLPSDTLNRLTRPGDHFGFPYCHQGDLPDPEFGVGHACGNYRVPASNLGAHVAALGMRFYKPVAGAGSFPARWNDAIFIAEHGSWNRSSKVGYRVVAVHLHADAPPTQEVFAEGWLQGQQVSGRPVDVLEMPDGALLVSDDLGGRIWRVARTSTNAADEVLNAERRAAKRVQ